MLVSQQNPNSDIYIISEPNFTEPAQCLAFVQANSEGLVAKAYGEFNGRQVESIYCVEKEKLRKVIKDMEYKKGDDVAA